jgi:hypothetical protein
MAHGHVEEALEWANLVLRAQPAHPAMNRLLADYYRRNGQPALANSYELHAEPAPDRAATKP